MSAASLEPRNVLYSLYALWVSVWDDGRGVVNVFVSPFFVLITFDAHEDILFSLETKL